jgi:hypothetical protein
MKQIKKILLWPIYMLVLRPLIKRNYKLREQGKIPDEWHWADLIAIEHGYYNNG